MKKNFLNAVGVIMMTLCAVLFASCNDVAGETTSDYDANGRSIIVEHAKVKSCEVTLNTYQGNGVVKTRATEVEHLDGKLVATSRHLMTITGATVTERTYSGTNTIEARGVLKARYAKTLDSFKESNLRMSETTFNDGRVGFFVNFVDGTNHNFYYSFIIENNYDTDTIQVVNAQSGKVETLQRCKNEITDLEFLNMRKTDLQRDSAGWHAYSLVHVYSGRLSEGPNNGFTYEVNIPLVWVWKGNDEPEYPEEDNPTPIVWEDGDEGFDFVNDSTSQSWKDIIPTLSDGTKGKPDRIAVLLKNTIVEPEYQVKTVEDFNWSDLSMQPYDEVKDGDRYDKENKISVQPYMKSIKTRTNKCDAIFILKREGAPIYTDSLGGKHYLPERSWTATDDGWTDKKLDPSDNFERLLLTSHIIGTFNEHSHNAKGEVELKKVKGEEIKIIGYEYPEDEKGLEAIVPNESYKTWRNQYTVFSNGKKEFNGKVSTTLYLKTIVDPEKQTVTVTDWDIKDLSAQPYNPTRSDSRPDKQETGTFTITSWSKNYVTRTNKSEDKFVTTYDGTCKFTDKYGNEVEFISLAVKQEDLGGVKTMRDLNEENDFERKLMTTSIRVTETNTSTSAESSAEVLFQKPVEREELLSWNKEQSLDPAGNGLWTSTTTIIYNWKLAGRKTDPISVTLDWSIVGDSKSHVILEKAEAPYKTFNEGSWGNATKSYPYDGVTVVTSSKSYTEDYTTLTDKYTAKMSTASYSKVVDGKTIAFDFLAPSSMVISHASDNLVDGKRTTTENGTTYDVYDHTGSVTATVTGNGKSQSQPATDEKEIWVKHEESKASSDWALIRATLVYNPNGSVQGSTGAFSVCVVAKNEVKKQWAIAVTKTWGSPQAKDFDVYYYSFDEYPSSWHINSAIYCHNTWEPANLTGNNPWYYEGAHTNKGMTQQEADMCGIKNFTGAHTAENNAILNYSSYIANDGTLVVRNNYGTEVLWLK